MSRAAAPDLQPGMTVWLTPRTVGAGSICYREPKATVESIAHPFVTVTVDGERHQVHENNIRLTDPARQRRRAPRRSAGRPSRSLDGVEEIPLF